MYWMYYNYTGEFGSVQKGILILNDRSERLVAVKTLKGNRWSLICIARLFETLDLVI